MSSCLTIRIVTTNCYCSSLSLTVFSTGKRTTSRILDWFVIIITSRSTPMPQPVVGGSPYSNAYSLCPKISVYIYESKIRRRNLLVTHFTLLSLDCKTLFLYLPITYYTFSYNRAILFSVCIYKFHTMNEQLKPFRLP